MKKILLIFLVLICSNANSSENVINNLKIVKEVNFKSETYFDNCGVIYGKFNFFSNGKSEEIYTCQETKRTWVNNGDWKDMSSSIYASSDTPKLSWIDIAYSDEEELTIYFKKNFIETTYWVKTIEKSRWKYVYTDENYNEKEKSKAVKKKNENSKDLSGNAIDCYAKNTYKMRTPNAIYPSGYNVNINYHATIKFLNETKVKFALAIVYDEKTDGKTKNVISEKEFEFLLPGDTFTYEVREKAIVIKITKDVKNLYDPSKDWNDLIDDKGGEIKIWRETLDIFDPYITYRAKNPRMKCKLVEYDDAYLFNKYREFNKVLNNLLQKLKKESESKNIL